MYYAVLIINSILFLYVLATLISPVKALFFIREKSRRKRWPWSVVVFVGYLIICAGLSSVFADTPERKAEIESARLAEEKAAAEQAMQVEVERQDSILRAEIAVLNKRVLNNDGPTSAEWRKQQMLLAQRDSLNLVYVEYVLDNRLGIDKGSAEDRELTSYIKMAANATWKPEEFIGYFNYPGQYSDEEITRDGIRLQSLIDTNNKKAIRLNQELSRKIK